MTDTLFTQLAERAEQDRLAADCEWNSICHKIARGDADVASVSKVLKRSGRSVADLQREVSHIKRIAELRETIAQSDHVERQWSHANGEFVTFCAERQARHRADIAKLQELTTAKQAVDSVRAEIHAARCELDKMGISEFDEMTGVLESVG